MTLTQISLTWCNMMLSSCTSPRMIMDRGTVKICAPKFMWFISQTLLPRYFEKQRTCLSWCAWVFVWARWARFFLNVLAAQQVINLQLAYFIFSSFSAKHFLIWPLFSQPLLSSSISSFVLCCSCFAVVLHLCAHFCLDSLLFPFSLFSLPYTKPFEQSSIYFSSLGWEIFPEKWRQVARGQIRAT